MGSPSSEMGPSPRPWLWIELIGFDNQAADLGVGDLLRRMVTPPEVISLLLYTPDFVHTHDGLDLEQTLPPDFCAYCARPYSPERGRQPWTNHQLKGLIDELHRNGIATYCSFFNLFSSVIDGLSYQSPWCAAHPEVWEMRRSGERLAAICPLHRLADGSPYEAFFLERLRAVMVDYGFDGYQGADGFSSTRLPVHEVDFSDDMVGQWTEWAGIELPLDLRGALDAHPERLARRADWVLREAREQWLEFYATRGEGFWRNVVSALHPMGLKVVLNSAWTRDPFEAYYRYGVDYRRLAAAGIDGFIVETVSAGVTIGAEGIEVDARYDYQAMLLLMKAYTPGLPLRCLNGVHDTCEQWDVLRHAPAVSEREIHSLASLYVVDRADGLQRCSAGPVVCLGDSVEAHEWRWLEERWRLAFGSLPSRTDGVTLLWSDAALRAQLADFLATRRWTTHKIVFELMAAGAPIRAAAGIADLDAIEGALLIANAHLLPADELAAALRYAGGPVIAIGGRPAALPRPPSLDLQASSDDPMGLCCLVFGGPEGPVGDALTSQLLAVGEAGGVDGARKAGTVHPTACHHHGTVPVFRSGEGPEAEPMTFLEPLPFRAEPDGFVRACATLIGWCSGAVAVVTRSDVVRAWSEAVGDAVRVYATNDSHCYATAELDVRQPISKVTVVTPFPRMPIRFEGSRFAVKIPPRGIVVAEVR